MTVILCCRELILGYGLRGRGVDELRLSPQPHGASQDLDIESSGNSLLSLPPLGQKNNSCDCPL